MTFLIAEGPVWYRLMNLVVYYMVWMNACILAIAAWRDGFAYDLQVLVLFAVTGCAGFMLLMEEYRPGLELNKAWHDMEAVEW